MLRILVILAVAAAATAQVPFFGACPNLETTQNFDLNSVSMDTHNYLTRNRAHIEEIDLKSDFFFSI